MHVLVVGNVVEDRRPDGGWAAGGPSLYAARMAVALGAEVTLVSGVPPGYDRSWFEGLALVERPVSRCTRYENTYPGGRRVQTLLERGEPLQIGDISVNKRIDALIVTPALDELRGYPDIDAPIRIACLQGPLRSGVVGARVREVMHPIRSVTPFLAPGVIASFSDEDVSDHETLANAIAVKGHTAIVTRAARGAWLYHHGTRRAIPAISSHVVDPTGAGDCFAAAFAVRLVETGDAFEACLFANAVGSLVVERQGLAGLPSREDVAARLLEGAA